MGLVAYVCFMIALSVAAALLYTPSERLLAYVHCPRYYVVRRIDYLHYRSEKAHYILRFVASCASVRAVRGAVAFSELAALVGAVHDLNQGGRPHALVFRLDHVRRHHLVRAGVPHASHDDVLLVRSGSAVLASGLGAAARPAQQP